MGASEGPSVESNPIQSNPAHPMPGGRAFMLRTVRTVNPTPHSPAQLSLSLSLSLSPQAGSNRKKKHRRASERNAHPLLTSRCADADVGDRRRGENHQIDFQAEKQKKKRTNSCSTPPECSATCGQQLKRTHDRYQHTHRQPDGRKATERRSSRGARCVLANPIWHQSRLSARANGVRTVRSARDRCYIPLETCDMMHPKCRFHGWLPVEYSWPTNGRPPCSRAGSILSPFFSPVAGRVIGVVSSTRSLGGSVSQLSS